MAISIKYTDLDYGQVWYIKTDIEQLPHTLVGLLLLPGKQTKFGLSCSGEVTYLYDFECSRVKSNEFDIADNDDE